MRNKLLSIIACVIVALVTIIACDKKKDIVSHPAYSEFATPLTTKLYFVRNDPSSQLKIPVGITTVSNTDRKIVIKDSSRTAVNGTQYTIESTTITIPAGKASDSLVLKGIYAGYPVGRVDTIYLKIVGGDVPANAYNTTYMVIIQGYCDVNINDFEGDYHNVTDVYASGGKWGPYDMDLHVESSTPTSATVTVGNVYDSGIPDITTTVKLDWSNPSSFTSTIPDQVFSAADDIWIKGNGTGTFSSCAGTITLKYTLYTKSDGKTYDQGVTTMKR